MTQLTDVLEALQDGAWHTLADLAAVTGAPEASVSTRLRDLRLEVYGRHPIETRRRDDGLFEYRDASAPEALSDLGRRYLAATARCRRIDRARVALTKAIEAYQALDEQDQSVSRLEDLTAARDALAAARIPAYRTYLELGVQTTEADLRPGTMGR